MQHFIILLVVALCAFFLGRRLYRSLGKSSQSGCGCSCSGCGPKLVSICRPDKKSDTAN
ncbi:MAG: FeoB-associated Cys-rich membrane protein [Desulfobulbaceae bacterium]